MKTEKTQEISNQIDEIKPIINRLRWDKSHDQLNPGKLPYLESLEKKYEELKKQLDEGETPNSEVIE